ncbi:MAG: SIS domain-containing protein [Anaerolineales bacterium]|nr:SIS domain-containing protein [Anaerolineales bacterium]
MAGIFTRNEIASQPEAWSAALEVFTQHQPDLIRLQSSQNHGMIFFTGCGSTYYLALAAAALTQELTGMPARALPASELWLSPRSSYVGVKTLLVAISRSGSTSETLRACEMFLADGRGDLLTLSCYGEMPLAKMGNVNIVLPSGQERSVAQTRAFSTLFLATTALAALWGGQSDLSSALVRLPEAGARLLKTYASLAAELGRDASIDRFYWLGSAVRYGLASELSLKMKEMSLTHSEPFHFMEFRHGPKSMVTNTTLIVGLQSTANAFHEAAVLAEMRALGGRVLDMAESGASVSFESGLDQTIRNLLYLPVGQMIAFERALSKGLDPDHPQNLDAVVRLPER